MPVCEGSPLNEAELALLRALGERGVPFLVVGLGAAVMQGAALATADLDLWFRSTADPGVEAAARSVGGTFVWRTTPQMFSGPGMDAIDVVAHCDGLLSFDEEYARAIEVELAAGLVVRVLPLERILASKLAAGRPKDLAAVPMLQAAIAALRERAGPG